MSTNEIKWDHLEKALRYYACADFITTEQQSIAEKALNQCKAENTSTTTKNIAGNGSKSEPTPSPLPPDTGSVGTTRTKRLWDHMAETHKLNLLESEINDIKHAANAEAQEEIRILSNSVTELRSHGDAWSKLNNKFLSDITNLERALSASRLQAEELRKERDNVEGMYGKVAGECLKCDPIPASKRDDDQLEPPWEVVARLRAQLTASQSQVAALNIQNTEWAHKITALNCQLSQLQKEVGEAKSALAHRWECQQILESIVASFRVDTTSLRTTLTTTQAELATAKATIEGLEKHKKTTFTFEDDEKERINLREALTETLRVYVELANSGDAGNWDPEKEPHVIKARAVLDAASQGTKKE